MKTNFTVEEMLFAYKMEIYHCLQEIFGLSVEGSVLALDMTTFEERFLADYKQFNHTEPITIARETYEKWITQ